MNPRPRPELGGPDFDFRSGTPVQKSYALCYAPRSGSNQLSHALWRTGLLGAPMEYFNYNGRMFHSVARFGANTLSEYFARLQDARTSPNGVFAAKLLPGHWLMLKHSTASSWIANLNMVVLCRRDTIAQAISQDIAHQTGAWYHSKPESMQPVYDYQGVLDRLRFIESVNLFWFNTVRDSKRAAMLFPYEDFIDKIDQAVVRIAAWLKVPLDPTAVLENVPLLRRQATQRNTDWKGQFLDDLKARGDTVAPFPFPSPRQPGAL